MFPDILIGRKYIERGTAFKPEERAVFEELLADLDAGIIDGIVSWHPDRLSRNEINAAQITYRLRKGVIKDLRFCSYNFDNSPEGIMMLQLALSQSQYFSAKLSKDVKRGIEQKLIMGGRPGRAALGYLNDRNTRTVVNDEKLFGLVQRMWVLMLSGLYSPARIMTMANYQWGLRTPKRSRSGDGPMGRGSIYAMFRNPFYAGYIRHSGQLYKGNHTPMVTWAQFERVQELLDQSSRPRTPQVHEFAYTSLIRCGDCRAFITAQLTKGHAYYHCTHRKTGVRCMQRGTIREERLEDQLITDLDNYTIDPEFYEWACNKLSTVQQARIDEDSKILASQRATLAKTKRQLDTLVDLRTRDLIDDREFVRRRDDLRVEVRRLEEALATMSERDAANMEKVGRALRFALRAHEMLRRGNAASRRAIAAAMGSEYLLTDRRITFTPSVWLVPLRSVRSVSADELTDSVQTDVHFSTRPIDSPELATNRVLSGAAGDGAILPVQTVDNGSVNGKTAAFTTVISHWCSVLDCVQTAIRDGGEKIRIPDIEEDRSVSP